MVSEASYKVMDYSPSQPVGGTEVYSGSKKECEGYVGQRAERSGRRQKHLVVEPVTKDNDRLNYVLATTPAATINGSRHRKHR